MHTIHSHTQPGQPIVGDDHSASPGDIGVASFAERNQEGDPCVVSTPSIETGFRPRDVLQAFSALSRSRLDQWRKIDPRTFEPAFELGKRHYDKDARPQTGLYSEQQLTSIAILNRCYEYGLSVEQTKKHLEQGDSMLNEQLGVRTLGLRLLTHLILADEHDLLMRALNECLSLLHCEEALLLELREDEFTNRMAWEVIHSVSQRTTSLRDPERLAVPLSFLHKMADDLPTLTRPLHLYGSSLRKSLDLPIGTLPHSVLALSICLKKNTPKFFIWAQNKLDKDNRPHPARIFDFVDEATLELLGRYLVAFWQFTVIQGLHRTFNALDAAPSLKDVLKLVLSAAAAATGAYRGDITTWSEDDKQLKIILTCGATSRDAGLHLNSVLGNPSICRWVFEKRAPRYARDVTGDPFYKECNPRTRSQFAQPIISPHANEVIGVLNLESDQLDGFSEQDRIIAEVCSQVGSQFAHFIVARDTIVSRLLDDSGQRAMESPSRSILKALLSELSYEFGFRGGLVYLPNHTEATLAVKAAALEGGDSSEPFTFDLKQRSLATKVFRDGVGYFSPDPWNDLHVDKRGLETFRITGPVMGVPLTFGGLTIGVVTLWDHSPSEEMGTQTDATALRLLWETEMRDVEVFARDYVSGSRLRSHESVMAHMSLLRDELFEATTEQVVVAAILRAVTALFDRVRLCRTFPPGNNRFVVVGSQGIDRDNALVNKVIEDCNHVIFRSGDKPICQARRFDPQGSERYKDPNADILLKPTDLPFANGPLWSWQHGTMVLLGYIGADNKQSKRRITRLYLDALDRITILAASALSRFESWNV